MKTNIWFVKKLNNKEFIVNKIGRMDRVMKNHKKFIVALSLILLLLVSFFVKELQKKEIMKEKDIVQKNINREEHISDLFKEAEEKKEIMAQYGYTITNYDKEKRVIDDYHGGEMEVDFKFYNSGAEAEVGIMIYIDGIAQKYKKKGKDDFAYIIPITLEKETDSVERIYFTPEFGANIKEHTMNFECIFMPSYQCNENNRGFGNYHHALPMLTWKIIYDYDGNIPEIFKKFTLQKITKKTVHEYFSVSNNNEWNELENLKYSLIQDGKKRNNRYIDWDASKIASFALMGGESCTYRLSAYINHEPVNIFDGKKYADVDVKKNKITEIKLDIGSIKKKVNNFDSFYIMISPLLNDDKFTQEKMDSIYINFSEIS